MKNIEAVKVFVFFVLVMLLPFVYTQKTADPHFSLSWFLLAILLGLGISFNLFKWQIKRIITGFLLLLISVLVSGVKDVEACVHLALILVFASIDFRIFLKYHKDLLLIVVKVSLVGLATILTILFAKELMLNNTISHEFTYSLPNFFPARNVLATFIMLLSGLVCFLESETRVKTVLVFSILGFGLVFLLQAKAAALSCVILCCYLCWRITYFKQILITSMLLFIAYNVYVFRLFNSEPKKYVEHVASTPDILKTLNIHYNLKYVSSIEERERIWGWTLENLNVRGHGVGKWKYDVQGNISLPKYDCHTIIRRVHNELLKLLYENGILGICIFLVLFTFRNHLATLILLPPLLFSFPLERATLIVPIFLLLESGVIRSKNIEAERVFGVSSVLSIVSVILTLSFHRAELLYFSFTKDINYINKTSQIEKKLLELKSDDFLLNSFEKYQAFYWIAADDTEKALLYARKAYESMPNNYSNYKLIKELLFDFKGVEVQSQKKFKCLSEEWKKAI